MKKLIPFFCAISLFPVISSAQCPSSGFNIGGGGCAGQVISITNTSSNAATYSWDFCAGDFDSSASVLINDTLNIANVSTPDGGAPVIDGGNHYVFICSRGSATIQRVDYGSSFSNAPSNITNLGNPFSLFSSPDGIVFIEEAGIWHALVSDLFNNQVIKLDFGSGIANAPTSGQVLVSANLNFPRGIDIAKDSTGSIYAVVANFSSNAITVLSFGNSINNIVSVGSPIAIPSCSEPMDISLAHECGNWCAFVCSYGSTAVYRVDFGSSMLNTPFNFSQIITKTSSLSGISVVNDDAKWVIDIVDYNLGNIYTYSTDNLLDATPTFIKSNPLNVVFPYGIKQIKENSDWYGFTTFESNNGLGEIFFINSCNVNNSISSSSNPSNIIYNTGGTYNISLEAIDSSGNVSYSSKKIIVNPLAQAILSVQNTCFGDVTVFNDSSTISLGSITGRHWDFGDGNSSNLQSVTHTYSATGSYVVILSDTSNNGCVSADTVIVHITPRPSVSFMALSPVCAKTLIQFTDLSTISTGSITEWHWDFGNNDTSDLENPLYKYPKGGSFNAMLTATSDSGCTSSYPLNMAILDAPSAGFNVANTCIGATANFTDTSKTSSGAIEAWNWNFGDGDTSTFQNPPHAYPNSVSTYAVTLVSVSTDGCTDTAMAPVKINNVPLPSFSIAPSTICKGDAVQLTDQSSVTGDTIYAWHWNFGDSDTALTKDPIHSYADTGTFSITLKVYSQTSCSASSSQAINVVPSPAASFVYTRACLGDSTYFTDRSVPYSGTFIVSWHWDFGNGDTSNFPNPVYYFDSAKVYTVNLTITDNIGCTNTFGVSLAIHHLPVTAFAGISGCTSSPLAFFDASTSTDGGINSYAWDFGDPSSGSNNNSSGSDPTHIYYTAGNYIVSLTTTTIYGCSSSTDSLITINQSSAANFQYLPSCEKQQMIFTNLDSLPNLDSLWSWSFGDGGASFIPSPSHYYFLSGTYNVTLSVTSIGGCINTITKPVEVSPDPIADFVPAPACINSPYSLQDVSHVNPGTITQWSWSFGNGDSSTVKSPGTIYTDTGNYSISLIVTTAKGCIGSTTQLIHVYSLPVANFNYDPLFGSPPLDVRFNDQSSNAAVYIWQFGDGDSSSSPDPSHTYLDTGKFNITQFVYSNQGCADSLTKTIYVIKPRLDIAVTNVSYQFQNNLFKISAHVANLGTRDIANYLMQATIQNGATIDEYVSTPLPSGSQGIITYNFTAAFQTDPDQTINYYCISALNPDGETDDNPVNNEKCATVTNQMTVVQPFPNPFYNSLQLQFILPAKGHVTVDLFDNLGQEIRTLYDDDAGAGETTIRVPTETLGIELYFCRFTFKNQTSIFPIVKAENK